MRAASVDEAVSALAEGGPDAKVLAGGQSFVPMLNMRIARPALLVDVNRVPGLDGIATENGHLRVGAMCRQRAVERSALARERCPLLASCLPFVGHVATRNRGTVGGSIAHADAAAELPLALVALGGSAVAESPRGRRTIPADDLFVSYFTTALEPDELLVETVWPAARPGEGFAFEELALRHGDYALSMAACALRVEGGAVAEARLVVGAVAARPTVVDVAARRARGRRRGGAGGRGGRPGGGRSVRPPARVRRLPAPRHRRPGRAGGAARLGRRRVTAIELTVNGRRYREVVEPRLLASDFLRHTLGLTGTHVGCEHGVCGACSVRVDGAAVRSCLLLAVQLDGAEVRTVEGLAPDGELTPLQAAFRETHALQCGFCTPGILMAASELLEADGPPTRAEITDLLSGHLCRCTGYEPIVEAIARAAGTAPS